MQAGHTNPVDGAASTGGSGAGVSAGEVATGAATGKAISTSPVTGVATGNAMGTSQVGRMSSPESRAGSFGVLAIVGTVEIGVRAFRRVAQRIRLPQ